MPVESGPDVATADDVAELAGVSRWTVNRAFKKDASISDKARKKVMEAALALGYAPDLQAASLASDRSNLVALLVDDFQNPHKLVMMERLTRVLRRHGWDTLLVNMLDKDDASAALMNASQRRVDAAILIGVSFQDAELGAAQGARRVRKLIVFARESKDPNTISICCNDTLAMTAIAQHVIDRGYARPLFLAGPQTQSAHLMRKDTFLRTWQQIKGERVSFCVVEAYDPNQAYERVSEHLGAMAPEERPDVIVCENDALAMGASDAIRYKLGLQVPGDIAVTGFDDTPQAAHPSYRLTTYRQPLTAMAESLVRVLKGEPLLHDLDAFSGKLVIRESA